MKKELENTLSLSDANLNVVVVYDDVCSGMEAKDLCDCLAQKLAPSCELKLNFWSLASLQHMDLAQMAAQEATQAEVLIIALHGNRDLEPAVKGWFSHWARRTHGDGCAMVALLRGMLNMDRELSPAHQFLNRIAETASADYFSKVVEPARNIPDGSIEFIHRNARMASPPPDDIQLPDNEKTQGCL